MTRDYYGFFDVIWPKILSFGGIAELIQIEWAGQADQKRKRLFAFCMINVKAEYSISYIRLFFQIFRFIFSLTISNLPTLPIAPVAECRSVIGGRSALLRCF
jgi:hypothetical protein